jgi:hypothetical protein
MYTVTPVMPLVRELQQVGTEYSGFSQSLSALWASFCLLSSVLIRDGASWPVEELISVYKWFQQSQQKTAWLCIPSFDPAKVLLIARNVEQAIGPLGPLVIHPRMNAEGTTSRAKSQIPKSITFRVYLTNILSIGAEFCFVDRWMWSSSAECRHVAVCHASPRESNIYPRR